MNYLLDTNIISETIKKNPNPNLIKWLESIPSEALFISVLSLGEIRKGVESVSESKKKTKLLLWLEKDLTEWFEDRILDIDTNVSDKWGYVCAKAGKSLAAIDSLLAATALTHNLKLVTRNEKDFKSFDSLEIVNPF